MTFSILELKEFLLSDPDVRILIVEGRRDVSLWHDVVPVTERNNCVIYSIEEIQVEIMANGNKGAAIRLASETKDWEHGQRVSYFLDADHDKILGVNYSNNITLTDCRDMEAYCLLDSVFSRLCKGGANENDNECIRTKDAIKNTIRRVGVLRLASARNDLNLPFQETFKDGSIKRFIKRKGNSYSLKVSGMMDALGREGDLSHADKQVAINHMQNEEIACNNMADSILVHGKDLVAFLAWHFNVGLDISAGMIALSIASEINSIRILPEIAKVEQWVRAA